MSVLTTKVKEILQNRYLLKDNDGKIVETPHQIYLSGLLNL